MPSKGDVTVNTLHGDKKSKMAIVIDCGNGLADAIKKFSEEVVFANYLGGCKVQARNNLSGLSHGENVLSPEQAQAEGAKWKPCMPSTRRAKDPVTAIVSGFDKMTPEQKQTVLKLIQAQAKGK